MQLSERLKTIIDMTAPCKTAADIGTDHGFVPITLVAEGKASRAIACDVRPGPLLRAKEHVQEAGLSDRIECRLGDGLLALKPGDAELVIIAGMGGGLTARILTDGVKCLDGVKQLVLSPHTDSGEVRRVLVKLGYFIEEERMLFEEGKYYVVIRAVKAPSEATGKETSPMTEKAALMTEDELDYGPCLLRTRPQVFISYLEKEADKAQTLLENLRKEAPSETVLRRIGEKETEYARITGILRGE